MEDPNELINDEPAFGDAPSVVISKLVKIRAQLEAEVEKWKGLAAQEGIDHDETRAEVEHMRQLYADAEQECSESKAENERLQTYTFHLPECAVRSRRREGPCDCGFEAINAKGGE